jgi:molybdopterin-biosynthesis enzyme MoeA-like protein
MESEMAPFVDVVMKNNPYVYIKSHPKGAETTPVIEFHLSTTAKDASAAKNLVNEALAQLTDVIKSKGGTITATKSED